MAYYEIAQWTVKQVAEAFKINGKTNENERRIVIPVFQRGLKWKIKDRKSFIDSLDKGFPFGSLLLAKTDKNNIFSVVDGLQRGSTISDFVFRPLSIDNRLIEDETVLVKIREVLFPGLQAKTIFKSLEAIISNYFDEKVDFEDLQPFHLAKKIEKEIATEVSHIEELHDIIADYFKSLKNKYQKICDMTVPIVIYSGPQELLGEIFNRINKKGVKLDDYDIYAAVWDKGKRVVNDDFVVSKVIDKYLELQKEEFTLQNVDLVELRRNKSLTIFEYLFGVGKFWIEKYDCLKVESAKKVDEINPLSFEIFDACINESRAVSKLDQALLNVNINKLQKRIEEAIDFVEKSINIVSKFKGNKRKSSILHAKYQIISMIANTFREMYDLRELNKHKTSWEKLKDKYGKQLLLHYIADIITDAWSHSGDSLVYSSIRDRRYSETITRERWGNILSNFYQAQKSNKLQSNNFSNPTNEDAVILNCIYIDLFTAKDQLSNEYFDIEHLATKEKMKVLMNNFKDLKLPVSCIANYCYLPQTINRGKKDKTIYEAQKLTLDMKIIEEKYSFTKENDFEWLISEYNNAELLKENYYKYLDNRFSIIKDRFNDFYDKV